MLILTLQEILRFYPAVVEILRVAKEDNVLPLSRPVVGLSGKVYKELPVPAGTAMYMFPMGYNLYVCRLDPPLSRKCTI